MMISVMATEQGFYQIWSVELSPTRLRDAPARVVTSLGNLSSSIGTFLLPIYLDYAGWKISILTYFFIWLLVTIFLFFKLSEGKKTPLLTLDELDKETIHSKLNSINLNIL